MEPPDGGKFITNSDMVEIYTLPQHLQSVLEGNDGKYYAINYYTWVDPTEGNKITEETLPGISVGTWWDDVQINMFFPWGGNEDLAEQLSSEYQTFANENNLLVNGDLILNGYDNGGGFIFDNWSNNKPPESATQRPNKSSAKAGLVYEWNGAEYYTRNGNNNRIQAFGGCAVNTISSGKKPGTNDLVTSAIDPCEFEDGKVREDTYAPVFQGGTLKTIAGTTNITPPFWIGHEGGTIDNSGIDTTFAGKFSDISSPNSEAPGNLNFKGEGTTTLSGKNIYLGKTTVKEGVLEITNVDGLGSADAGTRVEEDAVLRISLNGEASPQGSTSNDAKINEEITLAGGELDLNGNYIDLRNGVVLEGNGVNSKINVNDKKSRDVFIRSVVSGEGGLIKEGEGYLRLGGTSPQAYRGQTIIKEGELRFAESTSTPESTDVTLKEGATLRLMGGPDTDGGLNTVRTIEGEGRIVLNTEKASLRVNVPSGQNPIFEGSISGGQGLVGTFSKDGDGSLMLSGQNAYGTLKVEGGELEITGQQVDESVALELGGDLKVIENSVLRVTGKDLDLGSVYGPRQPGEVADENGTIRTLEKHQAPVIQFNESDNELEVEEGGLLVTSYIDKLPRDYDDYKNNCEEGSSPETCYKTFPEISMGEGNDILVNEGLILGPAETGTGNQLNIRFDAGNDSVQNNGWIGCLTGKADAKGWNGYQASTCVDADDAAGGKLTASNVNLSKNYNASLFMGAGNDEFVNDVGAYIRGSFSGQGGSDTLTNKGVIRGNIVMGGGKGSDVVVLDGSNASNDGSKPGQGVVDDRILLGNNKDADADTSESDVTKQLTLRGNAVVSYRNSVGWNDDQCGGHSSEKGGYGCRWDDGGYTYTAVAGSKGKDTLEVQKDSGSKATIWGSIDLGGSTDALVLGADAHLDLVGDLDLGSGESQTISVGEGGNFSVRSIQGDVDLDISGLATLGGDQELGVFEADVDLQHGSTLSTYSGTTTINAGGTLRAGQAWSLSKESALQVDGTLTIGDNPERDGNKGREDQQIAELKGSGNVSLEKQSHLFFGGTNQSVQFSGTSSGNGSLVKEGSGTTSITGELAHTGYTKVHDGILKLGSADATLSKKSVALISSSSKFPTLDLGGTTQDVNKFNLHGGTLKNGSLSPGNSVTVNRRANTIDGVKGDPDLIVKASTFDDDSPVSLMIVGANEFQDLTLDRAEVVIASGSSLTLDEGINGGDFAPRSATHPPQDILDVQGTLSVENGSIDLGAGNDVLRIGPSGSVSTTSVIQGGSGDFDVFWNKNVDLNFVKTDIDGFEIVAYAGEGLAYLGEKTSAVITASEFEVPMETEYGFIRSTNSNSKLIFNSDVGLTKSSELASKIGLLRLEGDSTLDLNSGSLEIAVLESTAGSNKKSTITLGSSTAIGSASDINDVASGSLSIGASDYSVDAIKQKGGVWLYEGDYSTTPLSAQGLVVVGLGDDAADNSPSASFKSITADGSRRLLVGARKGGQLTITNGLHDNWKVATRLVKDAPKKASLLAKGDIVLDGIEPSTYHGATVVMEGGSITTKGLDAISPASPTLVRGDLNIGDGTENSTPVEQTFARRLIVGRPGSINNGKLSVTSLANFGNVEIASLTVNNGMKRILDALESRKKLDPNSPLRRIKAQGSLKNIGGTMVINGDLVYANNEDAEGGHALFNIGLPNHEVAPGYLNAGRILMGDKNDVIFNAGIIASSTTDDDKTSINLGGGNDLILNRGTFEIGSSIIDGGEPLEITGSILNRDTRSVKGLNIFRGNGTTDPGLNENQLVNFAAIKFTADGDWIFPQGNDCRVTGDGRTFSENKTDCVGIVGQRNVDQFLRITDGAHVETGVVELGRSSDNSIEVLDGSLDAGLIDGVIGSYRINQNSGDIVFDRSINSSYNSLIVGDPSSTASVKAKAIHNISSIHIVNGSLDAELLHATDLAVQGQDPMLLIGSSVDISSVTSDDESRPLLEQISGNAVKGTLKVDETQGYAKALQLGGMWGYEGDFGDIDLSAQGIVTTTRTDDDSSINDDDEQEDIDEVTFKSITAAGKLRLLVGAREGGKLTILEGLHDSEKSRKAAIFTNGELTLGDLEGNSEQVASTYRGATVAMKAGSIQTLYADAISPESPTLVRGELLIGDSSTGPIEQNFAKPLIVGRKGSLVNGELSVTSLTNAGTVVIDGLTVNNGMTRLIDRLEDRNVISDDSPLLKIQAQGSLKNLGGTIEITGDLEYLDDPDANRGHALLNIYNPRKDVDPLTTRLTADRILMGANNDVILNSGTIEIPAKKRIADAGSINLGGGNDLILNRGKFDVDLSFINGGEELDLQARPVQGLNVFRQGFNDARGEDQASGLTESQLVNFAAIKLEHDGDWIFPQGGDCQVRGKVKLFDQHVRCVGITGLKKEDQKIVIDDKARVEAGVVALGRDSTNKIHVKEGALRAVLIEGGNEVLDRFRNKRGLASNELPTQKEVIVLGEENSDAGGELVVGGIVDVESITQLGGTWSYAIDASEDDFGVFPDTTAAGTLVVKEITLNQNRRLSDSGAVSKATFQRIDGEANDLSIEVDSNSSLGVIDGIHGDKTALTTQGEVRLSGESTYGGFTTIQDGGILYSENNSALSEKSSVVIEAGGLLDLQGFDNTISSLSGEGDLVLNPRASELSDDDLKGADLKILAGDFWGTIQDGGLSGIGSITKAGDGDLVLSGVNSYSAPTFVEGGRLISASSTALSPNSAFTLSNAAVLDLSTYPRQAEFRFDENDGYGAYLKSLKISDQSRLTVSSLAPLRVKEQLEFDQGEIAAFLDSGPDSTAPIQMDENGQFVFAKSRKLGPASLYMVVTNENARQEVGVWNVIDGEVENADELAKNTYLLVPALPGEKKGDDDNFVTINGRIYRIAQFDGVNQPLAAAALSDVRLEEGSLKMVVAQKSFDDVKEDLNGGGESDDSDPDEDGDGELDQLPGCEVGDNLCDVISDIDGDKDDAWEEEEEVAVEIIEGLVDGLEDEEIDLPLGFDYGELAKLVASGLAPRNVDAAGRGLALHNNLLVDAVFDRQPLRQFEELLIAEEVVEESVAGEEAVIEESAPVQPLWLKAEELGDGEATAYVEGAVAEVEVADVDVNGEVAVEVETEEVVFELDGLRLVDQQDDELDLAKRDGVSAWVKGFGGNSRADESSILYNDYDLSAYGTSFGVDVALSESFQIGAYANYGDLNVHQHSGDTGGGSWNPEGWGGGITAQYSTRHFYVQGLLGASEFSGEQSRNILRINSDLGGNTAKGDKSVTSYLGALRIGAPFKTGGVVLEPQGQVVWTRNQEQGFSESHGTEKNLRLKYKSRTTNFAETELGMKLSVPIRTGERSLLVPSLRAAWLADWNTNNEGQEIGYKFTKKTATFDSQLGTENGALIEAGLDYTVQNFNGVSVKLYGRGGMELWASDRGTTWRASGGVTFQF